MVVVCNDNNSREKLNRTKKVLLNSVVVQVQYDFISTVLWEKAGYKTLLSLVLRLDLETKAGLLLNDSNISRESINKFGRSDYTNN